MQEKTHPTSISWDFDDRTKWLPFYTTAEGRRGEPSITDCCTTVDQGFSREEYARKVHPVQESSLKYEQASSPR